MPLELFYGEYILFLLGQLFLLSSGEGEVLSHFIPVYWAGFFFFRYALVYWRAEATVFILHSPLTHLSMLSLAVSVFAFFSLSLCRVLFGILKNAYHT